MVCSIPKKAKKTIIKLGRKTKIGGEIEFSLKISKFILDCFLNL